MLQDSETTKARRFMAKNPRKTQYFQTEADSMPFDLTGAFVLYSTDWKSIRLSPNTFWLHYVKGHIHDPRLCYGLILCNAQTKDKAAF